MAKIYDTSHVLTQAYLRKIAQWATSSLGNDIYYLKEVVDMLLNEIGEDKVVDMLKQDDSENKKKNNKLGEEWDKFKKSWKRLDILLSEVKPVYDLIENKKFDKINKENEREFIKKSKKISLLRQDVYTLFVFLIKSTNLQRYSIPSDAWKIIERSYKVVGASPQRILAPPTNPEVPVISHEE